MKSVNQKPLKKKKNNKLSLNISNKTEKVASTNIDNNSFYDFLKWMKLKKYKPFTREEEYKYISEYKNGNKELKVTILERNLGLVISVASKFANRGIDIGDLVNEGVLGLNMALERFELSKKCKFSTYAVIWIYKYISVYISDNKNVLKIPYSAQGNITKVLNTLNDSSDMTANNYNLDELSKKTNLSKNVLSNVILNLNFYSIQNLDEVLRRMYYDNTTISTLNNTEMSCQDFNYELDCVDLNKYLFKKNLQAFKERFPEKYSIIKDYYGLEGSSKLSIDEIKAKHTFRSKRVKTHINSIVKELRTLLNDTIGDINNTSKYVIKKYITEKGISLSKYNYYFAKFWAPSHCSLLPDGLNYLHFVISVNYGVKASTRLLQLATKSPIDMVLTSDVIDKANSMDRAIVIESYKKLVIKYF